MEKKDAFLEALLKEIELQKDYLTPSPSERAGVRSSLEIGHTLRTPNSNLQTIYFGGGTPSLLSGDEIKKILDGISKHHDVSEDAEITLEANPDDLSEEKLKFLKAAGINRLS